MTPHPQDMIKFELISIGLLGELVGLDQIVLGLAEYLIPRSVLQPGICLSS